MSRASNPTRVTTGVRAAVFLLGVIVFLFSVSFFSLEPRSDREWSEEFSNTAYAETQEDGTVTLSNIRDWTYGIGEVRSRNWIAEVSLDPEQIVRAWFVLEPFAQWEAVGHTYLTFEFSNGHAYSFSVEARREPHEEYSALKGLFRHYELSYTWGTERDFLTRRLLFLGHPVRMYPLSITQDSAKALFRKLAEKTNELVEHPRFYNTLTASCTNVLAEFANESVPGSVPYDISWNLPGTSDEFLMRLGFISLSGTTEETKTVFDLSPHRGDIAEYAADSHVEFGVFLRSLLPGQRNML